eukprot:6490640-Amphidinium_carterae.5
MSATQVASRGRFEGSLPRLVEILIPYIRGAKSAKHFFLFPDSEPGVFVQHVDIEANKELLYALYVLWAPLTFKQKQVEEALLQGVRQEKLVESWFPSLGSAIDWSQVKSKKIRRACTYISRAIARGGGVKPKWLVKMWNLDEAPVADQMATEEDVDELSSGAENEEEEEEDEDEEEEEDCKEEEEEEEEEQDAKDEEDELPLQALAARSSKACMPE